MAQFLRPSSDVSAGAWTTTPLWSKVNETASNDSPFISSNTGSNPSTACTLGLTTGTAPASGTRTIRVRARKNTSGGQARSLQVDLRDSSGTLIQSFATGSLSDAWVTQSFTVTNSISSYTGLRLEIIDVRDGGGAGRGLDVSWVEFEIPDAAPTFDITGGTTTPMQTTSGTMTFVASAPTFDITGAVTTPIQVGSGTIDFVKPIYEIDGAVTIPIQIISGAADFVKPIYTIDGAVTIPIQVGSGTATFGSPSFDINGAVNIPMQTVSGTADFVKPIYSITGGVTTPIATVSGTATTGAVTGLQAAYWDGTQYRQGTLKVYHNSEWKNINLQRYKNGQWH